MKKKTLKKEVKRLNKIIDALVGTPVSEEKTYQEMSSSFSTTTTLDDTGIKPPNQTTLPKFP